MEKISTQDVAHLYGIDAWGKDYFGVNNLGHLTIQSTDASASNVDLFSAVNLIKDKGIGAPLLLRFPQMIERRLLKLSSAFQNAIDTFAYKNTYQPVFPIKVNQNKSVVSPMVDYGEKINLGLEAGSKPELLIALAQNLSSKALTVCNGFKDFDYIHLASIGTQMGKKVVAVIEKPFELKFILELKRKGLAIPQIGFRIKLQAKGSGLWEKSGGDAAKFGLSSMQLIQALNWLKEKDLLDHLTLIHFHIGSQVTEIRKIKAAIREASRVYAKIKKGGAPIKYLDVGGGLGVDYDGSKTSSDASVNYTVEEYANDVVYTIQEICNEEGVPHPLIISESGRALVTHHALLIVQARDVIREESSGLDISNHTSKHAALRDLLYIDQHITVKNFREYYHDGVEKKDECQSLFNLGMLSLEERATGEMLYTKIARKAVGFSKSAKFIAEEFTLLEDKLVDKLVCNFSVFESVPDHWALDQLFPIVPIQMLNTMPMRKATLVDITCDSDGEIEKFVDLKDIKATLEVHDFDPEQPYYLGILMIGAYQEIMGNPHNLFGKVNEANIIYDPKGIRVEQLQPGQTCADTIALVGYHQDELIQSILGQLRRSQDKPKHKEIAFLTYFFETYTYLGKDI